jgi:hypothetical protein
MHPSHVKSKENIMYPVTTKDFYSDPGLRRRLYRMAQRERAAAVRAGFAWLREHLSPGLHPGDWIGRLG